MRALGSDDPLVLAGGSNVVLADDLADLTVVLLANTEITVDGSIVRAEAGAVWDDVVVTSLAHGLGGLECLSGIPGSAGATPVQNVGAYGAEVADTIRRVRLLDRRTGEDRWVAPDVLQFGYRTSILRTFAERDRARGGVRVGRRRAQRPAALRRTGRPRWAPKPGSRADPFRVREAVLSLRTGKGMVLDDADHDTWSVGSFFTNPVVTPGEFERLQNEVDGPVPNYPAPDGVKLAAGWLVERAGFGKGYPGDGAPVAVVDQACAGADQPRRRHHRGRDCAGQDGTRRRQNDIRDRTHTRASPDWVRSLGTLGPREPRQSNAVDQPTAGADRPRGRSRRAGRTRRLLPAGPANHPGSRRARGPVADLRARQRGHRCVARPRRSASR